MATSLPAKFFTFPADFHDKSIEEMEEIKKVVVKSEEERKETRQQLLARIKSLQIQQATTLSQIGIIQKDYQYLQNEYDKLSNEYHHNTIPVANTHRQLSLFLKAQGIDNKRLEASVDVVDDFVLLMTTKAKKVEDTLAE